MDRDLNAPPLNPLPWIVWALALPLIAVEVVVQLGASGPPAMPAAPRLTTTSIAIIGRTISQTTQGKGFSGGALRSGSIGPPARA